MRVLPDVVGGRSSGRLIGAGMALAAVTALAVTGLAGCAQFDKALGQQQAIVSFRDGTSVAQKLAVRAACAKVPDAVPQALPSNLGKVPYALQQLTFQVNNASDADIAKLQECLDKFPSVVGVTLQDSSDEGN